MRATAVLNRTPGAGNIVTGSVAPRRGNPAAVELAPREDTVAIHILLIETATRPVPFIEGDGAIPIDIEARELVPPADRGVPADFGSIEHIVVVTVERIKRVEAAVPLVPFDASVGVHVEILEPVLTVVVHACRQELGPRQHAVAVAIDTAEGLEVVVPLVRRDAPVAIVIDVREARLGPGGE